MSRPAKAPTAPILVTMGEPGGIGPEIAIASYAALQGRIGGRSLRLVGDEAVFRSAGAVADDALWQIPQTAVRRPGLADPSNAQAVLGAIGEAVRAAMAGQAAAVVTAPIHKASLIRAGFRYAGHTEYLAHLTGARRAVMMLAGGSLRVVPFTIHTALRDVPSQIDMAGIVETAEIVLASLAREFGISHPRLAVAGLNPHAGEAGEIGREEIGIIAPAIELLRTKGHDVVGPLPADTMFHAEARARYDAALCMYHDQALIPLKTLAFWDGVNVTLGLPIVRTSPDHGTALDIAGKGIANPASMIAAIKLAAAMADAATS